MLSLLVPGVLMGGTHTGGAGETPHHLLMINIGRVLFPFIIFFAGA